VLLDAAATVCRAYAAAAADGLDAGGSTEEVLSVPATAEVITEGQRRGEIRTDEPAEALAVIVLYAVLFAAQRGTTIGRPRGSSPLGRLALQVVLRGMRPS
jgi:hypothetical protein